MTCKLLATSLGGSPGRSSGYGRSWVRIPVPYTGWTFSHINLLSNCIDVCLKKTGNKRKRGRDGPIFLKNNFLLNFSKRLLYFNWLTCNQSPFLIIHLWDSFKPCSAAGYFLLHLTDCMLDICMQLAGARDCDYILKTD